ncbi:hypothetical protein [Altererythrobacter sp. MTPC7]|uniref:hypothetical protein n=1 Tax=Altererythrobacter sp. MTPC7 TaxID=3056567 RepID=UPI0036F33A04
MIVRQSRLRQIGWLALLSICLALFVALSFRVNAVKSEVVRTERAIIALERETRRLETEFQTRANQQQLATWNRVEFGYEAPRADQYFDTERQLAELGEGRAPGAPSPIRVARAPQDGEADAAGDNSLIAMVSPLTGRPANASAREEMSARPSPRQTPSRSADSAAGSLADRLGAPLDFSASVAEVSE